MFEHLFGSKTRLKLLKLFFQFPERSFFVRELVRTLDTQINAIRRELETLQKCGIIKSIAKHSEKSLDSAGVSLRKYFILNTDSLLYSELHALLLKAQVLGEQKLIEDIREKVSDIRLLLLTGRFTGDLNAKSDLLAVGDIKERTLGKLISEYEKDFGVVVRFTVLSTEEFLERRHLMDKFLFSLFEGKYLKVIDKFE
jgi:metal-responsive CopG/Arc/MetJ family transcriptional regulator